MMGRLGAQVSATWDDVLTYADAIYGEADSPQKAAWTIQARAKVAAGKKITVPNNIVNPKATAAKALTPAQQAAQTQATALASSSQATKYVLVGGAALIGVALVIYLLRR